MITPMNYEYRHNFIVDFLPYENSIWYMKSTSLIVAIASNKVSKDEHRWYYIIEIHQARISLERKKKAHSFVSLSDH
jgi:hypothetical protein